MMMRTWHDSWLGPVEATGSTRNYLEVVELGQRAAGPNRIPQPGVMWSGTRRSEWTA